MGNNSLDQLQDVPDVALQLKEILGLFVGRSTAALNDVWVALI
jgi:hypothetical protein